MTDRPGLTVICDAGPVIHLDELGCIDLLYSFSRVLIPAAVWQEVQRHRSRALALPCLEKTSAIKPEPPELEAVAVGLSLHTGEWEAISVALGLGFGPATRPKGAEHVSTCWKTASLTVF